MVSYEKLKNAERPIRSISEKDALKVLRKAKSERKEDFHKKIGKAIAEVIIAILSGSKRRISF